MKEQINMEKIVMHTMKVLNAGQAMMMISDQAKCVVPVVVEKLVHLLSLLSLFPKLKKLLNKLLDFIKYYC